MSLFFHGVGEPVTRPKVLEVARELADDPSTIAEVIHPGFEADLMSGGFAFVFDRGMLVYHYSGARGHDSDPGDEDGRQAAVAALWADARHRHRPISLNEVSAWHRAAIAALIAGAASVADLPPDARTGVDDAARADSILVRFRRYVKEPTEEAALKLLASQDWLAEEPGEEERAHSCAACGRPAIGTARGMPAVCDDCKSRTRCAESRQVSGSNTTRMGAGFVAHHVDDGTRCDQVTRDGHVSVGSTACWMGEAPFGGVAVVALRTQGSTN